MKSALKILATGRDNETLDIARIAMVVVTALMPFVMLWGIGLETWCVFHDKPFDMSGFFTGIGIYLGMFGTFLMGGAASLYFKKSTEPGGETTTIEKTHFTSTTETKPTEAINQP